MVTGCGLRPIGSARPERFACDRVDLAIRSDALSPEIHMSRSLFAPSSRWRALAFTAAVLVGSTSQAGILAQVPKSSSPTPSSVAPRSQILILGTGTPIIDAAHSGTSIGILVRGSLYIFDAGPGVERRLLEAVAKGTKIDTIPAVFITHLHSDHTLGLPALVYYHGPNAAFRGGGPLTVYGPPGISAMMGHIHAAWADDRKARAQVQPDSSSWQLRGGDITAGIVYCDSNVVVKAFEVPHQPWPHAFGYRVETPDRVIVISGDTKPSDAIERECAGCDVLLHEVYSAVGLPKAPPLLQRYHASAHTSTYELAEIATKAKPKLLILYHQLYLGGTTDEDLVREVRSRYNGRVVSAHDLDVY